MIDPVPVGYIELNQAVLRRAADISDREYQERMHEQMRRFRSLVQKGNEQSQNEARRASWRAIRCEFGSSPMRIATSTGSATRSTRRGVRSNSKLMPG